MTNERLAVLSLVAILSAPLGAGTAAASCSDRPGTPIQMNITDQVYTAPGGPTRAVTKVYTVPGELFVHELTHAWQLHNRKPTMYQWIIEGVQKSDCAPLTNRSWSQGDIEEQAATVNTWFHNHATAAWTDQADLKKRLESAEALRDASFHFIKDNIRLGKN